MIRQAAERALELGAYGAGDRRVPGKLEADAEDAVTLDLVGAQLGEARVAFSPQVVVSKEAHATTTLTLGERSRP